MSAITFETTIAANGHNTGIEVPPEIIEKLAAGRRPAVLVDVNGYQYRNTIGVMGGRHLISVSAAIRKETGLKGGDPVTVRLSVAGAPRAIEVPPALAEALDEDPEAKAFFEGLSDSLQRYHVDNVNGAKTDETRARRVAKSISLFRAGKSR